MDPISVVGLVDASVDLTLKCASAVKKMNDIASKYKHSELTLRSIAHNLDTMQFTWDRIGAWIQLYTPDENTDDDGFVLRMARFLETGTLVMDALGKELLPFSDETLGPTPKERGKLTQSSDQQFKKSDESAYSIVPSRMSSRMSFLTHQTDSQESIRSEEDIVYRRLSFEDDLFTAKVYKRNYRHPMLLRLLKTKSRKGSENIMPPVRVGHAHIRESCEDISSSVTDHSQEPMHGRSLQGAHLPLAAQETHQQGKDLIANEPPLNPANGWDVYFSTHLPSAAQETHQQGKDLIANEPPLNPAIGWDVYFSTHLPSAAQETHQQGKDLIANEPPLNPANGSETDFEDTEDDETLDPRSARLTERPTRQRFSSSNEESSRIFIDACEQGDYNTVKTFLEMGHDIDSPAFGAIHAAAMYGHIEIVQILLQHGASVAEGLGFNGSQPLHLAAHSGDARMIQFLLRNGAQIRAKNQFGEQPIHLAVKSGSIETLRILVGEGATLDCADHAGRQPLHCAADWAGRPGVMNFLIRADVDIDAQDGNGDTALHKLALPRSSRLQDIQLRLAKILLDNNANCDALNVFGHTPLYLATNGHQHDISTLLIKSGARYLTLNSEKTLRLHVRGSMHDMLYRFSAPTFLKSRIAENTYEEALVQRILYALDNLIASGIPVRMVRYDHQAEDDNEISQFLRMSNNIKLLLDRDPRTRLSKRYDSPVSFDIH